MIDLVFWKIRRKVKRQFRFLYDSGFRVYSSRHEPEHMGYWELNFCSKDLLLQLYSDRGEIMMNLNSVGNEQTWYGLGTVVFFITEGKEFIGNYEGELINVDAQLQGIANIFQKHYEKILFVFGDNYSHHHKGLQQAHERYIDIGREEYNKSRGEELQKYVPK